MAEAAVEDLVLEIETVNILVAVALRGTFSIIEAMSGCAWAWWKSQSLSGP